MSAARQRSCSSGMLMIPATTRIAAWGLIALLIAVFPANIHMAMNLS